MVGGNTDLLTDPGIDREVLRGSLTVDYDIGGVTLSSITSHAKEDQQNQADGDYTEAQAFVPLFGIDVFQTYQ